MSEAALPADFPGLLEAAEAAAMEAYSAVWGGEDWPILGSRARGQWIAGHARLLADLTRPASRDFWARWLAERVGLTVGSTAPNWHRHLCHGSAPVWSLAADGRSVVFAALRPLWLRPGRLHVACEIDALTDPAVALRSALLAVKS